MGMDWRFTVMAQISEIKSMDRVILEIINSISARQDSQHLKKWKFYFRIHNNPLLVIS
jgi:hypothetical protein